MNIPEAIGELLMNYDSVLIPDFGVLTAEKAGASIHPVEHSFRPPRKKIVFSTEGNTQSVLLADYLKEKNKITAEEIAVELKRFVNEVRSSLQEKGAYELKGIGKFYFDIEKQLQFASQPEGNFLLSSFGLPEFVSKPILRPENISNYTIKKSLPEKKKRKFIWFRF